MVEAIDPNSEAFSAYIAETGLVDYLKWVLVKLYEEPEKPSSHLEYALVRFMKYAFTTQNIEEGEYLKAEIERLTLRNQELEAAAEELAKELEVLREEERGSQDEDY